MSDSIPPRPHATREIIRDAAAELALKMDCSADDLANHYYPRFDGYEFARELERHAGWSTSRSMVDDLDEMEWLVDERVEAAEKQWFADNDIKPPLPIGTCVLCRVRDRFGFIDAVCEYGIAKYLVTPEIPDEHEKATGGRWVIAFESVKEAQNELSREA